MRSSYLVLCLLFSAGCLPPGQAQPARYAQRGAALCQDRITIERYLDARVAQDHQRALTLLRVNNCWLTGSERPVRRVTRKSQYRETGLIRVRLWGSVVDYWALSEEMCGGRQACRRASLGFAALN